MIAPSLQPAVYRARPADLPAIRAVLAQDPVWCAYALADLQPDVQPYCDWYIAQDDGGVAVVLLFRLLDPPVIFATGPGPVVAHILDAANLPPRIYMTARPEHRAAIEAHYDFGTDVRPMWRMGLADAAKLAGPEVTGLQRLALDDAPRMRRLYAHGGPFKPDAFEPYQVADGVFYGVEDEDGEVAAMGGTHIVDLDQGVAGVGNMYTRPDRRGRGYAGGVLRAICNELLGRGVRNIVLNVDRRNAVAQRIYVAHGFAVHCAYLEGIGQQRELLLSADDADGHG